MGHGTDPSEYGDDCLCCWPPGETPLAAYVSYEGLEGCHPEDPDFPQPKNAAVEVIQDPVHACYWLSSVDPYLYAWDPCQGVNNGCYQANGVWDTFKGWQVGNCDAYFDNVNVCGQAFVAAEGGQAAVVFNTSHIDHSLGSLMAAINMEQGPETKFDFIPASEEKICVRFARKKDATNILILVEPTEL